LYGCIIYTNVVVKSGKILIGNKQWAALGKKGIVLVEPFVKDAKQSIGFDSITALSNSKEGCVVAAGNLMKPERFLFSGPELGSFNDILGDFKEAIEKKGIRW